MIRIRMRFAAPLVAMTACGQPPPAEVPIAAPIAEVDAAVIDAAVIDAATDAPIDAGPAVDHVTLRLPHRSVHPEGFVSCHSFGAKTSCNPPPPRSLAAEVREVEIRDVAPTRGGQLVGLAIGKDDGITARMAIVVNAPRHDGAEASARIVSVDDDQLRVELALDRDQPVTGADLALSYDPPAPWQPLLPPSIDTPIASIERIDRGAIIRLDVGTSDGVDRGWTGEVLDRRGRAIPGGKVYVFKIMKHRAFVKVELAPARWKRAQRVRLDPP